MDLLKDASIAGISIIALTIGLTQWIKGLGVSGIYIKVTGFLVGLVLGFGYRVYSAGVPTDFNSWFLAILFGLVFALGGPGVFDAAFRKDAS
jgi:hypothetical protein